MWLEGIRLKVQSRLYKILEGVSIWLPNSLALDLLYSAPWWDRTFIMDNPYLDFDKSRFYDASLAWMECSDAVYVISGAGDGGGVDAEIKRAGELYIPVFHDLERLIEWDNNIKRCLR
jgi:hypothetical protein